MNDYLWTIIEQLAEENTEMVVNAPLRKLANLAVERAAEAGIIISTPQPSHIKYILERLGYGSTGQGRQSRFVYKHNEARHE